MFRSICKKIFSYFRLNVSPSLKCIFIHIPKTWWTSIESVFWWYNGKRWSQDHNTALWYRNYLGKRFDNYFLFTVVRNPWSRAVSAFLNVKRDLKTQKSIWISNPDFDFSYFLDNHSDCLLLRPQTDWILDEKGELLVDMVCRFENLDHDFSLVCNKIWLTWVSLPHLLNSGTVEYAKFYTDELIDKVAKMYKKEIELFWYTFQ